MSEKPGSPFAGLDKALLRSTKQPTAAEDTTEPTTRPAKPKQFAKRATAAEEASSMASNGASTLASVLASHDTEIIEAIRKTVKTPGREVSFVRLTAEEKGQLADIVYTYKRQGVKTTETEVNRIAVNYLMADYKANGEQSILARVLAALLA